VGAPVRGPGGRVVAAMSVSAPGVVIGAGELLELLPLVRRTADIISREYSGTAAGPEDPEDPEDPADREDREEEDLS
jgi:hypothetical protein